MILPSNLQITSLVQQGSGGKSEKDVVEKSQTSGRERFARTPLCIPRQSLRGDSNRGIKIGQIGLLAITRGVATRSSNNQEHDDEAESLRWSCNRLSNRCSEKMDPMPP